MPPPPSASPTPAPTGASETTDSASRKSTKFLTRQYSLTGKTQYWSTGFRKCEASSLPTQCTTEVITIDDDTSSPPSFSRLPASANDAIPARASRHRATHSPALPGLILGNAGPEWHHATQLELERRTKSGVQAPSSHTVFLLSRARQSHDKASQPYAARLDQLAKDIGRNLTEEERAEKFRVGLRYVIKPKIDEQASQATQAQRIKLHDRDRGI